MKTQNSQITELAKVYFNKSKKAFINGHTVKYFYSKMDKAIVYMIFRGKGTGCQIAHSINFDEVLTFINSEYEYRTIYSSNGCQGGAYFFKGTDKMIFSDHPFKSEFTYTKKQ